MPLESGTSRAAFEHNVRAEVHAGKPIKQSVAIAYAQQRRSGGKKDMPSYSYTGSLRKRIVPPHVKCSFLKKRMGHQCSCGSCGGTK